MQDEDKPGIRELKSDGIFDPFELGLQKMERDQEARPGLSGGGGMGGGAGGGGTGAGSGKPGGGGGSGTGGSNLNGLSPKVQKIFETGSGNEGALSGLARSVLIQTAGFWLLENSAPARWFVRNVRSLWYGEDVPTIGAAQGWWAVAPIYGSGRDAIHHWQRGAYLRAAWNGVLLITDFFLVKTVVGAAVKGGSNLITRLGAGSAKPAPAAGVVTAVAKPGPAATAAIAGKGGVSGATAGAMVERKAALEAARTWFWREPKTAFGRWLKFWLTSDSSVTWSGRWWGWPPKIVIGEIPYTARWFDAWFHELNHIVTAVIPGWKWLVQNFTFAKWVEETLAYSVGHLGALRLHGIGLGAAIEAIIVMKQTERVRLLLESTVIIPTLVYFYYKFGLNKILFGPPAKAASPPPSPSATEVAQEDNHAGAIRFTASEVDE